MIFHIENLSFDLFFLIHNYQDDFFFAKKFAILRCKMTLVTQVSNDEQTEPLNLTLHPVLLTVLQLGLFKAFFYVSCEQRFSMFNFQSQPVNSKN